MPVTEVAIFAINPSSSPNDPDLRTFFKDSLASLSNTSGYQFHLRQGVEDPNLLIMLGGWESVEFHQKYMAESEEAKRLFQGAQKFLTVDAIVHIDLDYNEVDRETAVLAINRQEVRAGAKEEFAEKNREVRPLLVNGTKQYGKVADGWQIGGEEGKDIFVLFTSWDAKDTHYAWPEKPENAEYMEVMKYLVGYKMIHGVPFDL